MSDTNIRSEKEALREALAEVVLKSDTDPKKNNVAAILSGIAKSSFHTIKPENKLIIRDSDSWNTAWGLITSYYWACYPNPDVNWIEFKKKFNAIIFYDVDFESIKKDIDELIPELKDLTGNEGQKFSFLKKIKEKIERLEVLLTIIPAEQDTFSACITKINGAIKEIIDSNEIKKNLEELKKNLDQLKKNLEKSIENLKKAQPEIKKNPENSKDLRAILSGILTEILPENFSNPHYSTPDILLTCFILNAAEHGDFNSPSILFYLLNAVGVKNIQYDEDNKAVALLSLEPDKEEATSGEPFSLEKYDYPLIGKFRIGESLPNPWYAEKCALKKAGNHWNQINGNLIIKLPPSNIQAATEAAEEAARICNLLISEIEAGIKNAINDEKKDGIQVEIRNEIIAVVEAVIEAEIYIVAGISKEPPKNPTEVLANYIGFTPYFPFGKSYDLDYYDSNDSDSNFNSKLTDKQVKEINTILLATLSEEKISKLIKAIVTTYTSEKKEPHINTLLHEIFTAMEKCISALEKERNKIVKAEAGIDITDASERLNSEFITPQQNKSTSIIALKKSISLTAGDRGGVIGFASDVQWLHFVPRMVSYNWNIEPKRRLKEGSDLANYPDMLKILDYEIPDGLHITVSYAKSLPDLKSIQSMHEYTSIVEVVLPEPPKSELQPIAMADFAAKRASLPFTCA